MARALPPRLALVLGALAFAPSWSCQSPSFGGSALLTELFVDNQSGEPLTVSWTVTGEGVAEDGSVPLPSGESTLLVKELAGEVLLPSEILTSLTFRVSGESEVRLELDEIDDARWEAAELTAVRADYTFVLNADDLP